MILDRQNARRVLRICGQLGEGDLAHAHGARRLRDYRLDLSAPSAKLFVALPLHEQALGRDPQAAAIAAISETSGRGLFRRSPTSRSASKRSARGEDDDRCERTESCPERTGILALDWRMARSEVQAPGIRPNDDARRKILRVAISRFARPARRGAARRLELMCGYLGRAIGSRVSALHRRGPDVQGHASAAKCRRRPAEHCAAASCRICPSTNPAAAAPAGGGRDRRVRRGGPVRMAADGPGRTPLALRARALRATARPRQCLGLVGPQTRPAFPGGRRTAASPDPHLSPLRPRRR